MSTHLRFGTITRGSRPSPNRSPTAPHDNADRRRSEIPKAQGPVPEAPGNRPQARAAARISRGPRSGRADTRGPDLAGSSAVHDPMARRAQGSEALALEVWDLSLDSGLPTIRVRPGKGAKPRIVPVHPELHSALASSLQFGNIALGGKLIKASRSTADRRIRSAKSKAE